MLVLSSQRSCLGEDGNSREERRCCRRGNDNYGRRSAPDGGIRRKGKPEMKEEEAVAALPTLIGFSDSADDDYGRRSAPDDGIRKRGKGKPKRKEEDAVAALPTSIGFFDSAVDYYESALVFLAVGTADKRSRSSAGKEDWKKRWLAGEIGREGGLGETVVGRGRGLEEMQVGRGADDGRMVVSRRGDGEEEGDSVARLQKKREMAGQSRRGRRWRGIRRKERQGRGRGGRAGKGDGGNDGDGDDDDDGQQIGSGRGRGNGESATDSRTTMRREKGGETLTGMRREKRTADGGRRTAMRKETMRGAGCGNSKRRETYGAERTMGIRVSGFSDLKKWKGKKGSRRGRRWKLLRWHHCQMSFGFSDATVDDYHRKSVLDERRERRNSERKEREGGQVGNGRVGARARMSGSSKIEMRINELSGYTLRCTALRDAWPDFVWLWTCSTFSKRLIWTAVRQLSLPSRALFQIYAVNEAYSLNL
ncbi:hypothetical protein ACLOJK_018438 [Asimina triloba]